MAASTLLRCHLGPESLLFFSAGLFPPASGTVLALVWAMLHVRLGLCGLSVCQGAGCGGLATDRNRDASDELPV